MEIEKKTKRRFFSTLAVLIGLGIGSYLVDYVLERSPIPGKCIHNKIDGKNTFVFIKKYQYSIMLEIVENKALGGFYTVRDEDYSNDELYDTETYVCPIFTGIDETSLELINMFGLYPHYIRSICNTNYDNYFKHKGECDAIQD